MSSERRGIKPTTSWLKDVTLDVPLLIMCARPLEELFLCRRGGLGTEDVACVRTVKPPEDNLSFVILGYTK